MLITGNQLTLRHLEGLYVTQCIVVEWHVPDGGSVRRGDVVATVETRKVTAELQAGADGVLRHKFEEGEYADITDIVGWIE